MYKVKYITNACIPKLLFKNFLLFFFTVCKNAWKEHKFKQQKYQKSDFYNKNKKNI